MLPDIDGYSICDALKRERKTNAIHILVATALNGWEDRQRGLDVGANVYLCKPFSVKQFTCAIDEAIGCRHHIKTFGKKGRIRFSPAAEASYPKDLNLFRSALFVHTQLPDSDVNALVHAIREMGIGAVERINKSRSARDMAIGERANRNSENQGNCVIDYFIGRQSLTMVVRDAWPGVFPQSGFAPNAQALNAIGIDELVHDEATKELRLVKNLPQSGMQR